MSPQSSSLKNQVIDGLKWSIVAKLLTQVFSWISTFMVIRILTPNDYGIVAISMVFFSFISMFTTGGFTSALVREQKRIRIKSDQIFTISIFMNVALSFALAVSAPTLAEMYNNDALTDVLFILAMLNPITSMMIVASAHLQMEMRFKEKAISDSVAALIAATVALICAMNGMSYWSLIISNIVLSIVRVVGYNMCSKSAFGVTFNMSGVKPMFHYAMNMQIGTFVWFAYNKADTMIVGKMLGLEKLGIYNVAGEIASVPMTKIGSILNDVGFAAFAKVKESPGLAADYLKKALRLTGLVAFPVFLGISAVSYELTFVVVGEKWLSAAPIMSVLCLVFPFRMLSSVMTNYANGLGESKFTLHNGVFTSLVLVSSIYVGSLSGLMGIAVGWVIGYVFVYLIILGRYMKKFNLNARVLVDYLPSAVIAICMLCVVHWVGAVFSSFDSNIYILLLVKILSGILFVIPFYYRFYLKEVLQLFRR